MNMKTIAAILASALLAVACGQGNSTPESSNNTVTADDSALSTVTFSASFPKAQAQAALIDDNTQSIRMRVRTVPKGTWQELFNHIGLWNEAEIADVVLTPSNPSQTVTLVPDTYRISASQFSASDPSGNTPIERSQTLASLTPGNHQVTVALLHGTWDFVDSSGTATTLSFQLLDNPNVIDTDDITAGVQPFDWDPTTTGDQTPADALGMTGNSLAGFHILGGASVGNNDSCSGLNAPEYVFCVSFYRSTLYPLPREPAVTEAEENVINPGLLEDRMLTGPDYSIIFDVLSGFNFQQYGSGNGNSSSLMLGAILLDEPDGSDAIPYGAGLFFLTDELPFDIPTFDNAVTSGGTTRYPQAGAFFDMIDYRVYPTEQCEFCGSLLVANIDGVTGEVSHDSTDTALDSYQRTRVVDSSTISGTLIEFIVTAESLTLGDPVTDPSYNGTVGDSFFDEPFFKASRAKAISRSFQLDRLSNSLGLKAKTANDFGDNCTTLTLDLNEYSTSFAWINGAWLPGNFNNSYMIDTDGVVTGIDWDGDLVTEVWEQVYTNPLMENVVSGGDYIVSFDDTRGFGVYSATTPGQGQYDLVEGVTSTQADLDGDGEIEVYERTLQGENSLETVEVCAHEFTLKGRQLTYDISAQ